MVPLAYFFCPPEVDWRDFVPPAGPSPELVQWLWMLTPPGALVVPIGARADPGTRAWPTSRYLVHGPPLLRFAYEPCLPPNREAAAKELARRMPVADYHEQDRQAPRSGRPMWTMKSALFRDIYGDSETRIADELDLRDDASRNAGDGSRSARRYIAEGRKALATLGAWPWCLAADGRLPRD